MPVNREHGSFSGIFTGEMAFWVRHNKKLSDALPPKKELISLHVTKADVYARGVAKKLHPFVYYLLKLVLMEISESNLREMLEKAAMLGALKALEMYNKGKGFRWDQNDSITAYQYYKAESERIKAENPRKGEKDLASLRLKIFKDPIWQEKLARGVREDFAMKARKFQASLTDNEKEVIKKGYFKKGIKHRFL